MYVRPATHSPAFNLRPVDAKISDDAETEPIVRNTPLLFSTLSGAVILTIAPLAKTQFAAEKLSDIDATT